MTDRRRRAALLLPPPATAGWFPQPATAPGVVLLARERKSSSSSPEPDAPDSPAAPDSDRDNPFAPPPPDAPDQEWRPRHRAHTPGQGHDGEEEPPQDEQTPSWGNQWSPRQPGRQSGGFGTRPGGRNGQQNGGPSGSGGSGNPGGLRWDPTDPSQRRARYALLAGLWAFFSVLFSLPEVALLLGVLAIYWGISSLRAKPNPAKASAAATTAAMEGRPAPTDRPATEAQPGAPASPGTGTTRPQVTAAVSGLVIASLALMMVAATFTVQIVYRDYFTCVNDALTQSSGKSCEKLLPKELRPLLGTQE
ncbi:hypothetical protein [Streptomyces hygroscopicus]|uniref:hypothetical protein n=1 Tax=Streptomyces hygroscopicus TaxID=1912 RepID=UPI001FCABB59|nr:hypothetical protein [Streptomyces hygroscopicus]BDH15526.1 hypothetical protein HOK021_67050 [Streptomyces hygroscopicus]